MSAIGKKSTYVIAAFVVGLILMIADPAAAMCEASKITGRWKDLGNKTETIWTFSRGGEISCRGGCDYAQRFDDGRIVNWGSPVGYTELGGEFLDEIIYENRLVKTVCRLSANGKVMNLKRIGSFRRVSGRSSSVPHGQGEVRLRKRPMTKPTLPKVTPGGRYRVHVDSWVMERNARLLQERLEQFGYRATIKKMTTSIARHRVYAGEFGSRGEAEPTTRRLNTDGFSPRTVQNERGMFVLEVGWSLSLNDAIDLAHRLRKMNYPSKIISWYVPTTAYVVLLGPYEKKSEALLVLESLKRRAFLPRIIESAD